MALPVAGKRPTWILALQAGLVIAATAQASTAHGQQAVSPASGFPRIVEVERVETYDKAKISGSTIAGLALGRALGSLATDRIGLAAEPIKVAAGALC